LTVHIYGQNAALDAVLEAEFLTPFARVRALSVLAQAAVAEGGPAQADFLDRLRGAGIHPLSVALGAADGRPDPMDAPAAAQEAITLAHALEVDPDTSRVFLDAAGLLLASGRMADKFLHEVNLSARFLPPWPVGLTIIPNRLALTHRNPTSPPRPLDASGRPKGRWGLLVHRKRGHPDLARRPLGKGALSMNVGMGWDGRFPESAHAERLLVAPWFPGEVRFEATGSWVCTGGITPPDWRNFKHQEGIRIAKGHDPDHAGEWARAAIRLQQDT
jgi:hypothetical protein